MRKRSRPIAALSVIALLALTAACSKSATGTPSGGGKSSTPAASAPPAVALQGTITFNQSNLAKMDAALKAAMKGKSLSAVNTPPASAPSSPRRTAS